MAATPMLDPASSSSIAFRVLGPLEVTANGRVLPLGGRKPRMLLATMLLQPNQPVSTDVLVDVLWPERAPRSAVANVRTYARSIRARLAEYGADQLIHTRAGGYQVTTGPDQLDLTRFEGYAARARQRQARDDPTGALRLLTRANALWRGDPLADLPRSHAWEATLARLDELRLSVIEDGLRIRIADRDRPSPAGSWHDVVAELRGLITDHPLREELWRLLMLALHRDHRTAEALRTYADAEQVLSTELGTSPGPQLRRARAELVTGEPQRRDQPERPERPATVSRAVVRRLSVQQVRPVPPVQSGQPAHPAQRGQPAQPVRAVRPLPTRPLPVHQLPLDLPDFTGRRAAVRAVTKLLRQRVAGQSPAVATFTGPPGAGKSALAVHVGHAVLDSFPDGQLHVDLGGGGDRPRPAADVLGELLRALGVPDAALPASTAERAALYRSMLASLRVCVVLDDAASAAQVRPLLPGTGPCAALVTSRARLSDLHGAFRVTVDALTEAEARELFGRIVGAGRVADEPTSAARILRHCGYLPLAIRVAGAKLAARPAWPLRVLADRLADERHRLDELRTGDIEVRASVAAGYHQLPPDAALALRLAGVLGPLRFPGWVVAALLGRDRANDVLETLTEAHLLEVGGADRAGQPRYWLPDLLRCYAAGQLADDPPPQLRAATERVLDGYLRLASRAAAQLPVYFFGVTPDVTPDVDRGTGYPQDAAGDPVAWFEAEHDTVTAVVDLAARLDLPDLGWRIAAACAPYYDLRGHHDEWLRTHRTAIECAKQAGDLHGQAILLRNFGQLHLYLDSYPEATAALTESLRLFSEVGDERGVGIALGGLGTALRFRGQHRAALNRHRRALALFTRMGERHCEAASRTAIGKLMLDQHRYHHAQRWLTEARTLAASIGDRHREAHTLQHLATIHRHQRDAGSALVQLDRAAALFTELGDQHCMAYVQQATGELWLRNGDLDRAQLLLASSLTAHRRTGDRRSAAAVAGLLGELHQARGQSLPAQTYFRSALTGLQQLSAGDRGQRPVSL